MKTVFGGRFFPYEKNLWSGNLEKYTTNLPEIFVRVRRSSDLVHATTRLKFLCLTTELGAPEKKVTILSKNQMFSKVFDLVLPPGLPKP